MGSFVNIDGLPLSFLEFMSYVTVDENDEFMLVANKGDEQIISKIPPSMLWVDDDNDVAIFKNRPRIPAPPAQ